MQDATLKQINKLNKNFYSSNALSFSQTRAYSWEGWDKLFDIIKPPESVLDIACGNGRFFESVQGRNSSVKYLGIDSSKELIEIARKNLADQPNVSFQIIDLLEKEWKDRIDGQFELVVAFGLLHHIPGYDIRLNLIKQMLGLAEKGGSVAFTLWQFMNSERQRKNVIKDLGGNDFILDWNNSAAERFCHHFDDAEIEQIVNDLQVAGYKILANYSADGKEGNLNKYLVFLK